MGYYMRDQFIAATDKRCAAEAELLKDGRYVPNDLVRIVLGYTHIDLQGIYRLLDHKHMRHIIDDMYVGVGIMRIVNFNLATSGWFIPFHHARGLISENFYIRIEDVLSYVECGDLLKESDAMRVICETFAHTGQNIDDDRRNGVLMMRSFFDYCIWPENRLDAPVKFETILPEPNIEFDYIGFDSDSDESGYCT